MTPFTQHTGIVATLDRGNIDTDQIISKEFLKSIKRTGFGDNLFEHWRFKENGEINPDFELNHPKFKGASILLTGNNFGCGSSREHAVWAIVQYGFRVVISYEKETNGEKIPGFADIFRNNSSKNGLLLIELSEAQVKEMIDDVWKNPGLEATINLENQKIDLGDKEYSFEVDSALKQKLLQGLDDIGISETYLDQIQSFEDKHSAQNFAS